MSITSLGIIGGFAGTGFSQRAAEADKLPSDAAERARSVEAAEHAEDAAGIGQTEEDAQTSERDADGRQFWEQTPAGKARQSDAPTAPFVPLQAKDPTGDRGSKLDLTG